MKNSRSLHSIWRASLLLLLSLACQAALATEWVPAPTPITVVSTGNAGSFASMTTVNGNPAIAYQLAAPDNDLVYVRANDAQGNTWGTPVVVQSTGSVGRFPQLLVVNGNPAIAYRNATGAGLSYIRATDANGSTWGTPVTIGGATVASISMALVAGRPAIAYQDNFVSLNYVRANDADGASWGTPQVLDSSSPNGTGNSASLAVINGNPAIGYQNQEGTGSQKYIRALDTTGASWGAAVVVDAAGAFLTGGEGDLAEVNGRPAMTYQRDNFLYYVRANDAIGANWGVPQNLAPTARFTSLKVISGFPAISYLKYDTGDLRYIRASNADGTAWNPIVEVDNSVNNVGRYSQLEVIAGNPAIAYQDETAGDLKYVRAPNPVVVSYTVTASAGANGSLNCVSPVNGGSTTTCTATPNPGYRTASISGCGGTATGVGVNAYTTGVISANCTVNATFALITVIINELDADTPGTDTAEFIELYDGGVGSTPLDGLVLVFYNGSNDLSYLAFDLDGRSTRPNGYFVLCGDAANTLNCDLDVTPNTDLIQNGQDAVALFRADATAFPLNTAVTTTNLVDALVYDTNDADDAGLLVLLNAGQPQVNEAVTDATLNSNQRCPNGSGGARNTTTYLQATPTPGATNACAPPGVVLTQSGGTTNVTEGGATDTYTLALSSPPAANVSIAINPGAQVTVGSSPVVFTTVNWATAQTVTVTAVDDLILEGAHSGTISHTVTSSDLTYNGLSVPNVVVNITDNEVDPCSAVSFPYTLPNNAPATLITAITCANANGVSADTINLNGQTVTLTASFADYDGATGLPRVDTPITLRNGTITRSGSNQFRLLQVGTTGNLMVRDMSLTNGGGATYPAMGGNLNANTGSVVTLINTVVNAATVSNSFNAGGIFASGTFTMANCTVSGNTAGRGAGLALQNGPALITNSVISGNVATSILGGGAMYIVGLDVAIINSTITGNYATATGATRPGGILSDISGANLTLRNTILWGNRNGDGTDSQIVNDSAFGSNTVSNSIVQGGQFGGLNAAPLFTTPLTASATPSTAGNFRLLDASPGIDAGANANVPADPLDVDGDTNLTEDARDLAGNPRRFDDTGVVDTGTGTPPIVDLGAFEKQTISPPVFPMDVDSCNLQFPTSFTATAGSTSPLIYGRIFEDDNGVLTSTPGAHPSIVAQVGHGPLGSDPRGGNPAWQWLPATFNTQVGNDDEYQGTFTVPFAPSNTQRSYTYRFSVDNGANYTYCDSDGNGTNGGLGFNTASLGTLTINPGGQPAVSINDVTQNEGNSGTTAFGFTVSLNAPSLNAVTFDIATADNTATVANGDYVANSGTGLVIPAGQTSSSFNVLVNGDTTLEPNETFFVNLSNVTGAVVGDGQGTGTIVNDEADPCAAFVFPYTLSGNTPAELIQAIQCANANGAGSDSIDLGGQTVTLIANHVTVFGTNNGLPEITTVVVVRNGTITRSSAAPFRFFHNSGNLTLDNLTLSNGDSQGDGGVIYNSPSSELNINNSRIIGNHGNFGGAIFNSNTGTTTLTNALVSGNRADSQGGGIRNRGILVLNNSTVAANFTATGAEGGGGIANAGTFSLTLNNSLVFGNEAQNFPATNEIVGVFTANNSLVGVNPTFVGALDASDSAPTTAGDYRLGPLSVATDAGDNALIPVGVTIDLDGNPRRYNDANVPDSGSGTAPIVDLGAYERQADSIAPVVTVTPTTLSVNESGATTDTFLVALDTAPPTNVTIALGFNAQVEVNAGSGFGVSPQTVTLTPANALAGVTVTVRAVDDAVDEASPHATTIVTGATSSATPTFNGLAAADVAVNIVDNDTAGFAVTQSGGITGVAEGGAGDSYDVVLLSQPIANVTVAINPDPQLAVAPTSVTFTSANWNAPQTVTVTAVNDTVVEGTHGGSITHSVTSADASYNGLGVAAVTATISDNDTAEVIFSSAGFSTVEGAVFSPGATLKVTANGAPGGTIGTQAVATIMLTPGSASVDDVAVTGSFVFPAGSTHDTVVLSAQVTVTDDRLVEAIETYTLSLAIQSGLATTSANNSYSISCNDSAVIAFATAASSVDEFVGTARVPVVLSISGTGTGTAALGVDVVVDLQQTPATATTPADYQLTSTSLSFAAGAADGESRDVEVGVVNDALDEDDETFSLTIGNLVTTGNAALGTATATATILDDDATPTLSITSPSQPEGNAGPTPMNFVVSLSALSGRDVSFTRATMDDTATAADNDYVAIAAGPLTIPAGDISVTIPVTINGDSVFEGNESFSVELTGIANATPGTLSGTGTIEEDDQQPTTTTITADLPDPSVVGQSYPVNVTVAAQTLSPTGTVTISDGSASCGPVTLTTGSAPNSTGTCNLTSTTAGAKTLTASYTAATSAFGNSSGTASHQVNPAATTISVSGPARSRINQPTSFSFALSVNAPGSGTPTGSVTLTSGAASCTATLPATSCNLTFSALGSRSVSASYAGDANFVASSSSGAGNAQTLVFALSDLAVTKSDGIGTYSPDELLVYTVTVRNLGADAAANIRVTDVIPAGLVDVVWSCDASGGVACPQVGGSGDLDATIAAFPVGGLLNYTFYGNADGSPQIVNTATLTLPADTTIEDPALGNNSATDLNLLDRLFQNGFEDALVNAAAGSFRLPGTALRGALDQVAIRVYSLSDSQGEALRVYARVIDNEMQYALATRDGQSRLRLAAWRSLAGDPTLSWTARQTVDGWLLQGAELR